MRTIITMSVMLAISLHLGCTTMVAADFQPWIDEEALAAGASRSQVESIVGHRGVPVPAIDGAYEYAYHTTDAWEHRKWLYWPVDLATVGVGGLLTLPIELAIHREAQRWALAVYDSDDRLVLLRLSRDRLTLVGDPDGLVELDGTLPYRSILSMVGNTMRPGR